LLCGAEGEGKGERDEKMRGKRVRGLRKPKMQKANIKSNGV